MLKVLIPFVGHGYNMPRPGELIDPPEDVAEHLIQIGVAARYETKVDPLPDEVKKNARSGSSRRVRARRPRTRKSSAKSATKS